MQHSHERASASERRDSSRDREGGNVPTSGAPQVQTVSAACQTSRPPRRRRDPPPPLPPCTYPGCLSRWHRRGEHKHHRRPSTSSVGSSAPEQAQVAHGLDALLEQDSPPTPPEETEQQSHEPVQSVYRFGSSRRPRSDFERVASKSFSQSSSEHSPQHQDYHRQPVGDAHAHQSSFAARREPSPVYQSHLRPSSPERRRSPSSPVPGPSHRPDPPQERRRSQSPSARRTSRRDTDMSPIRWQHQRKPTPPTRGPIRPRRVRHQPYQEPNYWHMMHNPEDEDFFRTERTYDNDATTDRQFRNWEDDQFLRQRVSQVRPRINIHSSELEMPTP
ncbi:hypothetical protein Q1695_002912 [Nippostrongylus brasiliensis]|nr:hypothetical protein Q1695_002912 [Nippostrongylus brasiliensis]